MNETEKNPSEAMSRPLLQLADLRSSGLLWLINTSVFHPRGFALGLVYDESGENCIGWKLLGDGSEQWQFDDDCKADFDVVTAFLAEHSR